MTYAEKLQAARKLRRELLHEGGHDLTVAFVLAVDRLADSEEELRRLRMQTQIAHIHYRHFEVHGGPRR